MKDVFDLTSQLVLFPLFSYLYVTSLAGYS